MIFKLENEIHQKSTQIHHKQLIESVIWIKYSAYCTSKQVIMKKLSQFNDSSFMHLLPISSLQVELKLNQQTY